MKKICAALVTLILCVAMFTNVLAEYLSIEKLNQQIQLFMNGEFVINEPNSIKTEEIDYDTVLPVYAVPAWRVNCYYVKDGKTELRDYMGKDVIERGTREYGALIINAQTGEVYDRFDQSAHSADYAGFLRWKDVGGKP
ncbi:MAG: hypothetical protein RSC68_18395 [Acinetobacter sp.]